MEMIEEVKGGSSGWGSENNIEKAIGIVFWNMVGLKRKDRDFWNYLEKFDVIGL